jgi:hypothetical protein
MIGPTAPGFDAGRHRSVKNQTAGRSSPAKPRTRGLTKGKSARLCFAISVGYHGGMAQTLAGIAFWIGCNVLYYAGAAALLVKNRSRDARIAAIAALLVGPLLLLVPVAQLLFVVPLYTIFAMNGLTLPDKLSGRSLWVAGGLTIVFIGLASAVILIHG